MRTIDADAMLARLEEWNTDDPTDKALYNFAWNRIIEQPTIELRCEECEAFNKTRFLIPQPERKKGMWIYKNDLKQYFCSECGYPSLTYDDVYIYGMDLPNFCEDCGVDMRTANEEGD